MKFCKYCAALIINEDDVRCTNCGKLFSNEIKDKIEEKQSLDVHELNYKTNMSDKSAASTTNNKRMEIFGLNSMTYFSNENIDNTKTRDKLQQKVIDICNGFHFVLAPPGCGKTDILADRISQAIKNGVSPKDMLCLTFTNRASSEMLSRIKQNTKLDMSEVFVGNVHKFCSVFLFENGFVPLNSSILDEYDVYSILLDLCKEKESIELDYTARKYYDDILDIQHYIYQLVNNHPNFVQKQINHKLVKVCDHFRMTPLDLFDSIESIQVTASYKTTELSDYFQVVKIAKKYEDYKNTYSLLDFDDLLLKTYTIISNPDNNYKRFKWIQVDEVQDLNPLQLAICDLLICKKDKSCIVYFGDEQQAIFSFMGTKLNQLRILKDRCSNNLHYLQNNYRSPSYLLNIYNKFANKELSTDTDFLPKPTKYEKAHPGDLVIVKSENSNTEEKEAVSICEKLLKEPCRHEQDQQRIAILVTTNADADYLAQRFESSRIPYFKLSGKDAFASTAIQTIFSHIIVCCFDTNLIAWAKIFRQLKLFDGTNQYAKSRQFVKNMSRCMMCPSDLIQYKESSYVNEFSKAYLGEIVLFDTETTGLNIYEDDIVQISALKIKNGDVTDSFSIILETDKEIPLYLGKLPNPLVEEYKKATRKYKRSEGLKLFLSFIEKNNILVAHNANFDYHILDNNLKRELSDNDFKKRYPTYFDTLKITKLVKPNLKSYKLKNLISAFNLDGHNSHLAQDDVEATKNLIDYCLNQFKQHQGKQEKFFAENRRVIDLFKKKYTEPWQHTHSKLFKKNHDTNKCLLTEELSWLYEYFLKQNLFSPCEKKEHIMRFLKTNVIDNLKELTLNEQISNHAIELNTYKEADLCESEIVKEKVFIATVHKAKGLEFENVIVMNAVEGVYPYFNSTNIQDIQEDARKFYVAISRAKIRLFLMIIDKKIVYSSKNKQFYEFSVEKSRFIQCIENFFEFRNA